MMDGYKTLDLEFLDARQTIGSFLIRTNGGLALIETGPESTYDVLKKRVQELGYDIGQVSHVFLTHIHFDHAGAAWRLADLGANIYVHPVGLPHLALPEKLWNSAAQIYGDKMEMLWGEMRPIGEERLVGVEDEQTVDIGGAKIKAWYTPGHAVHHIAWQCEDMLFTGDVAGVKVLDGPVVPPCPPPDIHLENWKASIDLIRRIAPKHLVLTHFGEVSRVSDHLDELEEVLDSWADWMREQFDQGRSVDEVTPLFMAFTKTQMEKRNVPESVQQLYEYANPSWMSVSGLMRYWKLKQQGRI